jgi:putative membrane protein
MRRIRATGWAIGLWLLLVVIFAIDSLGSEGSFCHAVPSLGDTCNQLYELGVAIVYALLFVVGVVILLLTRPDGGIRAFLVRVMVNTLALAGTLAVLSLVHLPTGVPGESEQLLRVPSGWLIVGALFAIVNVIVRPVLFAVFGRWILRTAGVAVVLVNAALFWIVSEISGWLGAPWLTPDPRWLWLFVDSIVFTVVLTVLDAFLGLDRPRLDAATGGAVWRFLDRPPPQRAHREHPAAGGVRDPLELRPGDRGRRQRARAGAQAGRPDDGPGALGPRYAEHAGKDPGDAPAARPDLREDRADGEQPRRCAARRLAGGAG